MKKNKQTKKQGPSASLLAATAAALSEVDKIFFSSRAKSRTEGFFFKGKFIYHIVALLVSD